MYTDNEVLGKEKKSLFIERDNRNRKNLFIPYNFYSKGMKLGIIGGVGMSIFLFALSYFSDGGSIGVKFLKYAILLGVLGYALNDQKGYLKERFQFKKGMLLGLFISAVSAGTLAAMNFLAFTFFEPLTFSKFGMEVDAAGELAVVTSMISLEAFVYGMIITFIILQLIKPKKRPV